MKSNCIVQVISEISHLAHLEIQPHPLLSLQSISNGKSCTNCQNLLVVINQLNDKIADISAQHNKLLVYSKKLIDLNYQLFSEQQSKFEETVVEFEKDIQENQAKIKELESVVEENGKTIWQYRNLLLEKDEFIAELEEKVENFYKQRSLGSPSHEIEVLKHHKREKSHQFNKLQKQNVTIISQNSKLKQQNQQLLQRIAELSEYVVRMEDDLANVNIKSPRMLKKFVDPPQFLSHKNFNQISRCSIDSQSPIHQDDGNSKKQEVCGEEPQRISLRSSFGPSGRVLRDVLNISGQTSNYFNFRTKQKFGQSNAYVIRDNSSENNQNYLNCTNVQQERKESCAKIMEIKQFQVHDSLEGGKKQIDTPKLKKQNSEGSPCIMIDPYYAYFVLTIQCLKMNWRNLDEVANISLADEWEKIIAKQIPINKWGDHLKQVMVSKISI